MTEATADDDDDGRRDMAEATAGADGALREAEMRAALAAAVERHAPVLLEEVVAAMAPPAEIVVDGTFGAGGYARALLSAGVGRVVALDRDPSAIARGARWAPLFAGRLMLQEARFGALDAALDAVAIRMVGGVVLDIGVSSMQIDDPTRGFSFQKDGPLDMRMGDDGPTAADIVNRAGETEIADLLWRYGEERASRRIARAIVAARAEAPIATTLSLAEIVASRLPRPKPGQPHPATRSFQALRIAVNDELGELEQALAAAERRLAPGGVMAIVTFHSLEDRIVKRFLQDRSSARARGSRHQPDINASRPSFELLQRKPIAPSEDEIARNPRARSAKLRAARRTDAPPWRRGEGIG